MTSPPVIRISSARGVEAYVDGFLTAWREAQTLERSCPLPLGWRRAIERLHTRGVDLEDLRELIVAEVDAVRVPARAVFPRVAYKAWLLGERMAAA